MVVIKKKKYNSLILPDNMIDMKKYYKKGLSRSKIDNIEESNIYSIGDGEYDKFTKKIIKKPLQFFLEKEVKVRFEEKDNDKINVEWLWVDIVDIVDIDEENDILIGELKNRPQQIKNIKFENSVNIKKEQIGLVSDMHLITCFITVNVDVYIEKGMDYFMKFINDFVIKTNEKMDMYYPK